MSNMKFTIITVCFNSAKTIERTIQSVLAQTYTNYEYIVVDGLSKDKTINIVQQYEPLFEGKMRWISENDTGIYNAMNKGIRMATGDVIGIVNSDDWLEINALQIISEYYIHSDPMYDTVFCGGILFHYEDGESLQIPANKDKFEKSVRHYQVVGVNHPAMFVPLSIYEMVGLFDERFKISADTDFILRCYYQNVSFSFSSCIITNMSDGGVSNSQQFIRQLLREKRIIIGRFTTSSLYIHSYLMFLGFKLALKRCTGKSLLKLWRAWRYRN